MKGPPTDDSFVDANILLYAYDPSSPHHQAAHDWLENAFAEPEPVGLAWMVILAFLRIGTSSRVLEHPFSITEAAAVVLRAVLGP
ncbi:MAG TPA: hypothetical protein VKM93_00570 [Terriglobia bacterium]|nr:hypothetical protein [Terriglobia bacterium]